MIQDSFVDEALLSRVKTWRDYFAAKVGFKNHWYPACFSRELAEGDTLTRKMLGEDILLRPDSRQGLCDEGPLHPSRRADVGKGGVPH